jgi:hypothetical protein
VIDGHDYTLRIEGASHVRIQDVVVRGGQRSAVAVSDSEDIELDGVTLYGSQMALRVSQSRDLRVLRSALRGHGAPWHSRFHHKNRAGSGYLALLAGQDFEIAHCELTDHRHPVSPPRGAAVPSQPGRQLQRRWSRAGAEERAGPGFHLPESHLPLPEPVHRPRRQAQPCAR